jgi:hypothetical protein
MCLHQPGENDLDTPLPGKEGQAGNGVKIVREDRWGGAEGAAMRTVAFNRPYGALGYQAGRIPRTSSWATISRP